MTHVIEENGHSYFVERNLHGRRYLHCRLRLKARCPARGIKQGNDPIILSKNHSHRVMQQNRLSQRFKVELTASARQSFLPLLTIYNEVAANFPDLVVASEPFQSVHRLMANSRHRFIPDDVESYVDLINTLNNPHYHQLREYYRGYSLNFSALQDDALIIGDPELIAEFAFDTFFITTTTNVLPQVNNTRLISSIVAKYNNNAFPVITIFWKDMNADVVFEVFNQLRQSFLVDGNVRRIYTDLCFKNCLRSAFPQAEVISTYDSFGRMIYQQAINHGVDFHDIDQKEFFMRIMALTLLPEDMVADAFNQSVAALSPPNRLALQAFINYIENGCINRTELVNFFNSPDAFTNAGILAKQDLQNRVGVNPTIWDFMKKYILYMNTMKVDLNKLQQNPTATINRFPRANNSCIKKTLLRRLWTLLNRSKLSADNFLVRIMHLQEEYCNGLIFNDELMLAQQLIIIEDDLNLNEEVPGMRCAVCGLNPVKIVCLPCLHTQMCGECSVNIKNAAGNRNIQCPFCNLPVRFGQGQFRQNFDGSVLMICEQCNVREISIVCVPCLHIRFCQHCCDEITASGASRCPACDHEVRFEKGYFP
ncbi:hypothetical protein KQX54_001577 [Cotesia glomerata]|uniref:RING-type domain-containing protein n=1 Tax=Cotesia glomerata TaxID=32391 RepID=A0AAV7IEV0_COTGL|nr:hypothetical protein KQX54_001577 [Cotesia glomerata]